MTNIYLFLLIVGPYALVLTVLLSLIPMISKWSKEDSEWYTYDEAWKRWKAEGEVGPMPRYDDFKRERK